MIDGELPYLPRPVAELDLGERAVMRITHWTRMERVEPGPVGGVFVVRYWDHERRPMTTLGRHLASAPVRRWLRAFLLNIAGLPDGR